MFFLYGVVSSFITSRRALLLLWVYVDDDNKVLFLSLLYDVFKLVVILFVFVEVINYLKGKLVVDDIECYETEDEE